MDEIEYKLNTKNSILVVNAIEKLITTIQSKYKPAERQKFLLENQELIFLREKCSSKDNTISLTACQGLLTLVESGVLDIGSTMSTFITLLPTAQNHSAIISTMSGLLALDLKSRLVSGQPYKCQFSFKSPQHPFITILEKNPDAIDEVLNQMHALCTHPDYNVQSNASELLRAVFLRVCCSGQRTAHSWRLLLSVQEEKPAMLLDCLCLHQITNQKQVASAFAAYTAVIEYAIYGQKIDFVVALLPLLTRLSNEMIKQGQDPRPCYSLIQRCFALDVPELRLIAGLTVALLADNLTVSPAPHLHELFNLCHTIINKHECPAIAINIFISQSLQWLHLPSKLTNEALKMAAKIIESRQNKQENLLNMPNLLANKTFETLLHTDKRLAIYFRLLKTWERINDDSERLTKWIDVFDTVNDSLKMDLAPFFCGILLEENKEDVCLKSLKILVGLVDFNKDLAVMLLPILIYKIANDKSPMVKMECLKAVPLMAKSKENVPSVVSLLNKIRTSRGAPTSFLIKLYTTLFEVQVRCFPYLQELLVDTTCKAKDLKWELEVARAQAVKTVCEIRPTKGVELVSIISSTLNRCTEGAGSIPCALSLQAIRALWVGAAVGPPSTWAALQGKLARDGRRAVQVAICELLGEAKLLYVNTPEYDKLIESGAIYLWRYIAESHEPAVVEAACDNLANYNVTDYTLKMVPEIYKRTVKLPAAFCKTPADAARSPDDVLDYIPCEIWAEVFKYTNSAALAGVGRLVGRLIAREVRGYRSGVYQPDSRGEPPSADYLPPQSVVRGVLEFLRKQATSPTYDCPESILLEILQTLAAEYPKPLPPLDLCFLHELYHRGSLWREPCLSLAGRQALVSGSAKRILDNYLATLDPGAVEEEEILMFFRLLPTLCRSMPPCALRQPVEKSLAHYYNKVANANYKTYKGTVEDVTFVKLLSRVKEALRCEKIPDANRNLLTTIIENYYNSIDLDSVMWPHYLSTCVHLADACVERLSSPSSWWETDSAIVRRCVTLRTAMLRHGGGLAVLEEAIQACAEVKSEHGFALHEIYSALLTCRSGLREWMIHLMARIQVAFQENEDISSKLFLFDVFTVTVLATSQLYCLEADHDGLASDRNTRMDLTPAALAKCCDYTKEYVQQIAGWLSHSSLSKLEPVVSECCRRSLIAIRNCPGFPDAAMWSALST